MQGTWKFVLLEILCDKIPGGIRLLLPSSRTKGRTALLEKYGSYISGKDSTIQIVCSGEVFTMVGIKYVTFTGWKNISTEIKDGVMDHLRERYPGTHIQETFYDEDWWRS